MFISGGQKEKEMYPEIRRICESFEKMAGKY